MLTGVIKAIEKHSVRYPILVQVTVDKYVAVRIYMFFYCLMPRHQRNVILPIPITGPTL
jgi:hypothetical protein